MLVLSSFVDVFILVKAPQGLLISRPLATWWCQASTARNPYLIRLVS